MRPTTRAGLVLACADGSTLKRQYPAIGEHGWFTAMRSETGFKGWYTPISGAGAQPMRIAAKRSFDWWGQLQ